MGRGYVAFLGKLSYNFDPELFRCRDGRKTPARFIPKLERLHAAMLEVREALELEVCDVLEVWVVSAYRSPRYNDHEMRPRGAPRSRHKRADAIDFQVRYWDGSRDRIPPELVYRVCDRLQRSGEIPRGGLGLYNTFVHLDLRGRLARWNRSTKKRGDAHH